jgi:hypothetical protein
MRTRSIALTVLLLSGCASSARYMTEVIPPRPFSCPPDAAMVIFVRPSKFAWAVSANILDERGRFLGDSPAKGHFSTVVPPGRHMFVVWAENTDALVADLAPGRIYFIEVAATMGAFSARMHLKAIKPSLPSWVLRDEWIRETTQFAVDEAGGQAKLAEKGDAVAERLRRAQEHMAQAQGEELAFRTLAPTDGL